MQIKKGKSLTKQVFCKFLSLYESSVMTLKIIHGSQSLKKGFLCVFQPKSNTILLIDKTKVNSQHD